MHSVLKEWGDNALRPSNGQPAKSLSPQELRKQCRAQGEIGRGQQTDLNWPQPSEPRDPGQLRYNFSIILTDVEALSRGCSQQYYYCRGNRQSLPKEHRGESATVWPYMGHHGFKTGLCFCNRTDTSVVWDFLSCFKRAGNFRPRLGSGIQARSEREFIKSSKSRPYGPLSSNQTCIFPPPAPPGRWEKMCLHLAGKGGEELQKAKDV